MRCRSITFSAFICLSHVTDLEHLRLKLDDTTFDLVLFVPSSLTFPTLVHYELRARSSPAVWRFFDRLYLPSIQGLHVWLQDHPTAQELNLFFAALRNACNHTSLIEILLVSYSPFADLHPRHIDFHHLCPLTAFANIQTIHLRIPCGVDLSERELLKLASSWSRLEVFVMGDNEDCTESSAITPGGFVQLLERCRSLSTFSFPFNTRVYTEVPQGHPWHGFEMPENAAIDVQHSVIEEESIEALAVFFHVAPFPKCQLGFRLDECRFTINVFGRLPEHLKLYHDQWERVRSLARELWEERRNS